jgi:hypothetical protein
MSARGRSAEVGGDSGEGVADGGPGVHFMKLHFGQRPFGQIFLLVFWANFHKETTDTYIVSNYC